MNITYMLPGAWEGHFIPILMSLSGKVWTFKPEKPGFEFSALSHCCGAWGNSATQSKSLQGHLSTRDNTQENLAHGRPSTKVAAIILILMIVTHSLLFKEFDLM